jgi:hypothetical protein
MKRIAWLFLVVLGSVSLLHAQSSTEPMKQSGTVCNSSCVTKVDNLFTCDTDCIDESGSAVFVDDQGQVMKVTEQDQKVYPSHMGMNGGSVAKDTERRKKAEKMPPIPTEAEREQSLRISKIEASTP